MPGEVVSLLLLHPTLFSRWRNQRPRRHLSAWLCPIQGKGTHGQNVPASLFLPMQSVLVSEVQWDASSSPRCLGSLSSVVLEYMLVVLVKGSQVRNNLCGISVTLLLFPSKFKGKHFKISVYLHFHKYMMPSLHLNSLQFNN